MNSPDNRLPDEEIPELLRDAIRRTDELPFDVPQHKDAEILAAAGTILTANRSVVVPRRRRRLTIALTSVCVALLLLVAINRSETPRSTVGSTPPDAQFVASGSGVVHLPEDIDADGTVSILDAYAMARRMQTGEYEQHWDFNHDGEMDENDIHHVAAEAVML